MHSCGVCTGVTPVTPSTVTPSTVTLPDHHQAVSASQTINLVPIGLSDAAGSKTRGTHNLPTSDEVAVILPGDGTDVQHGFDVIVNSHAGRLEHVDMRSSSTKFSGQRCQIRQPLNAL